MKDIILFAILGLGAGAAYALVAQGLILIHRGTGVVNFAQGAIAVITAYSYVWLCHEGLSTVLAALIALIGAGLLGAVVQRVVMRPLARAPLLAKLVATLGLMLVLESATSLIFGSNVRSVPPLLPAGKIEVFGLVFGRDRAIVFGVAIILAAGLSIFSSRTNVGALLRGAADSEQGVVLLGYSLNTVATTTWVMGSVLAGFAGIILAPITSLDIVTMILLVIPALSVTLLAGFSSFWIATGAALVLGIGQSEIANYWTIKSPTIAGMQNALPFLLIIIVMVARGRAIPGRGSFSTGRPPVAPPARGNPVVLATVVIGAVVVVSFATASYQTALAIAFISALVALSLVVLTGYVGQISLAQMAFAGLGAYFCAKFADGAGIPFPFPIVLAGLAVVPFGVLLGLPALKVRGINLAVVTLGAAVAIDSLIFSDSSLTGGFNGIGVPSPSIFGYSLDGIVYPFRFAMVTLIVLVLAIAGVAWLRRSRLGLRMLAVRDNERAAAAEGVNIMRTKLIAFAVASFLAGSAGAQFAYLFGHISFDRFAPLASVTFVTVAYIGGIGSIGGAVIAGLIAAGGPLFNLFASNPSVDRYQALISGVGVVLTAVVNPDGLAPYFNDQYQKVVARLRWSRPALPSLPKIGEAAPRLRSVPVRHSIAEAGPALLDVAGLYVRYAGVSAVDGVSLQIPSGSLVGLIGPNGAGKTTFIDAICGFVASRGAITFAGQSIERLPAHERARLGLRRTFQNVELFEDLTLGENLAVSTRAINGAVGGGVSDRSVAEILELVGLAGQQHTMPGELSMGERKLAGLARALSGNPRLLLLDEPAAGLDSAESQVLGQRLRGLVDLGLTLVLVDHDLDLVMGVCDRVDVLDRGRLLASGGPEVVRLDPAVRTAYIGDTAVAAAAV
jgi:ABC-type branched-subunit amino acid transport system ATPase component/ABC-type branched-subunit amino acid transport system permease subunit